MARKKNEDVNEEALAAVLDSENDNGDEALARLLDNAGVKTLRNTYDGWNDKNVLSTGIVALDVASGIGGFPKGRIVEIFGDESAGKTTAFLHTVASAQRNGMPVVYIDAENALDLNYCSALGVDVDRMLVNQPESLEEAMDLMISTMKKETKVGGKQNGILFVFDSVPAIKSMEVMEKSAAERSMMAEANRWAENGPKIVNYAARTNSIVLLVNQTRADTTASNPRYAKRMTPGGKFIKFAATMRLDITAKPVLAEDKEHTRIGQDTKVKFVKNKAGGPGKVAEYYLPSGKPVDWAEDVISSAIQAGVVLADKKYDPKTNSLESVKSTFTLQLKEGWLDLIREDELDIWIDNGLFDAEQRGEVDDNGDYVNLNTVDNFKSEFSDDEDSEFISVRYQKKLVEAFADFERLLDAIEKDIRAEVRKPKAVAEIRKTRPDATKLNTKRLLTLAERRAAAAQTVGSETEEADAEGEKRKPGRPAKPKSEDDDAPKRGRGRPRKDDADSDDSESTGEDESVAEETSDEVEED